MKKVLCLLVALVFAGSIAFASGTEDIRETIVKIPDDQLIALRDMIQDEINYRGLEGDKVKGTFSPWYDYGAAKIVPSPEVYLGHLLIRYGDFVNSESGFNETVGPISSEDFTAYADFLIEMGFKENVTRFDGAFHAENSDGSSITLYLSDGKMSVTCMP